MSWDDVDSSESFSGSQHLAYGIDWLQDSIAAEELLCSGRKLLAIHDVKRAVKRLREAMDRYAQFE